MPRVKFIGRYVELDNRFAEVAFSPLPLTVIPRVGELVKFRGVIHSIDGEKLSAGGPLRHEMVGSVVRVVHTIDDKGSRPVAGWSSEHDVDHDVTVWIGRS